MLNHYELIDTKKGSKRIVHIGSTVKIEFLDTKEEAEYTIVGSTEADPLNGRLSNETPLAQAILDSRVGDTRTVDVAVPYDVIIIDIN
jgi:transcription elongation factor GreA